jgi:hypothetical protein
MACLILSTLAPSKPASEVAAKSREVALSSTADELLELLVSSLAVLFPARPLLATLSLPRLARLAGSELIFMELSFG